jgi:hypothetical protein
MYQGDCEYQGQTGYLMGHGNEPPPTPRQGKRWWVSTTLSFTENLTCSFVVAQAFFRVAAAPSGPGPPHYRGFAITLRHIALGRTPLDKWSARRTDLYLTIHNTHSRETSIHPGGIRTRNSSKRDVEYPRLRKRGHWNWYCSHMHILLTHFDRWQTEIRDLNITVRSHCKMLAKWSAMRRKQSN